MFICPWEWVANTAIIPDRRGRSRSGKEDCPADRHPLEKGTGDPVEAESSPIFYDAWKKAEAKPAHARMKAGWKAKHG